MQNLENEVKKRLREALLEYKITPTALAKRFGVNQKTLNNQINGDTAVSLSTILLISEALPDISLGWLIKGSGSMHAPAPAVTNSVNSNINSDNSSVIALSEDFVRDLLAEKDKQIQTLLALLSK